MRAHGRIAVALWAAAASAVLVLATGTFVRNEVWRDPLRLYAQVEGTGAGAVRSLLTLGVQFRHRGQLQQAQAALDRALRLSPASPRVRVELANVAIERSDTAAAERWLREAAQVAPTSSPSFAIAWSNLAWVLIEQRRYFDAFEATRHALAADPSHVPSLVNRAFLYREAGRMDLALSNLDAAIRVDPGMAIAWRSRATVRAASGDLAGSMADVEGFARVSRDVADVELLRGECLALADRRGAAREAFQRALLARPGDASAAKRLRDLGE